MKRALVAVQLVGKSGMTGQYEAHYLMPNQTPPSAVLIVNAQSRKGRQLFVRAKSMLTKAGVILDACHALENPDELPIIVSKAVAAKTLMVIIGGGDGSLSCAVDEVVGSDTVFAVLPFGTANSFARALGLPLDLAGAVDVIANGRVRRIDLGMIDDDFYAGCASMGLAPQIAETVPHGIKAWLGRPGYLIWAAVQFSRFRPFKLTVGEGENAETLDAVEVRIANGPFHGGIALVESARLDSGEIVVQAVFGERRRDLLFNWIAHLIGSQVRHRLTREFTGTSFTIATDPPLPISIDGEVLAHTPVIARVRPGAILVAAPQDLAD